LAVGALSLPALAGAEAVGLGVAKSLDTRSGAGDLLIAGRNAAPVAFRLSIPILAKLRLEPSAAYFQVGRSRANTPAGGSPYRFSATAVGLGLLYSLLPPAPLGFYLGARLTLALYSGVFMDQALPIHEMRQATAANLSLAPVVGGEYALSRHFALGVEAQLPVTCAGDRSARTVAPTNTPNAGHTFAMNTVFSLRYSF